MVRTEAEDSAAPDDPCYQFCDDQSQISSPNNRGGIWLNPWFLPVKRNQQGGLSRGKERRVLGQGTPRQSLLDLPRGCVRMASPVPCEFNSCRRHGPTLRAP